MGLRSVVVILGFLLLVVGLGVEGIIRRGDREGFRRKRCGVNGFAVDNGLVG